MDVDQPTGDRIASPPQPQRWEARRLRGDQCSDLYGIGVGEEKMARVVSVLLAALGALLLVLAAAAMFRRQDALAGGLAVLGFGAVLIAGLMPRLTGPVEIGLSGVKLQVTQISQAGQAAGYKQEDILAAVDEVLSGRESLSADRFVPPTPHVSMPGVSGSAWPGLDEANLAVAHRDKYLRTADPDELEHAITEAERAVAMVPSNSAGRSPTLGLLGELMVERFTHTGALADLDQAVNLLQTALAETAMDSPVYAGLLSQLAKAVQFRFETLGNAADHDQVVMLLQRLEEVRRR
jgi:hypothetical protein